MFMHHLPDNHWEYAETDEFRQAQNTLCNLFASQIGDELQTDSPEIGRLMHPLRARRIDTVIDGGKLWDEIHGNIGIRIRGLVRTGNGDFHNKIEPCVVHMEDSAIYMKMLNVRERIALITHAYAHRRDALRIFNKQCERQGRRCRAAIQRIFWLENLFLRRLKLVAADLC